MLKTRVVGVLVVKAGRVVQSLKFSRYLPVGKPEISVEFLNKWGIDEIVLLDIDATKEKRPPDYDLISRCAKYCQVPFSVGGGIRDIEQMSKLLKSGADKVIVNCEFLDRPGLITEGSKRFGSQCMIVSIDSMLKENGEYGVRSSHDLTGLKLNPVDLAKKAEEVGAGEIFLNSVNRDGQKNGYDLRLLAKVRNAVSIPVIICGGVGHVDHLIEGINLGVSAVAAANFFHFIEHSVVITKRALVEMGQEIRLDTYTTYERQEFDDDIRLNRRSEDYLTNLRFTYLPEEVI